MITIVDYGVGNLFSLKSSFACVGEAVRVSGDPEEIRKADKVVLPGVGDASCAMAALRDCGLAEFIPTLAQPVLGICVGLQLMCRRSEEGDVACMGIFDTDVVRFKPAEGLKIPHMGWNSISGLKTDLFKGLKEDSYVYYVHSYYPQLCGDTIATTTHGVAFSGALASGNFFGTQFHPEKSGEVGAAIIKNFLEL